MTKDYADLVGYGVEYRLEQLRRELVRLQEVVVDLQRKVREEKPPTGKTRRRRQWSKEQREKFEATLAKKGKKKA